MDSQTSFSRQTAKCVVLKLGCDKEAGSNLQRDRCGLCTKQKWKRDSCVGCDDVPYSNKKWGKTSMLTLKNLQRHLVTLRDLKQPTPFVTAKLPYRNY